MTMKKLVQIGSLSEEAAQFLEKIVKAGCLINYNRVN